MNDTPPNQLHILLPLPPSVNALHGKSKQYRSKFYNNWIKDAGIFWRRQFPNGVPQMLTGRLRAQIQHIEIDNNCRDIDNYCKATLDYLQGKFYENDSQIDELHVIRRVSPDGKNRTRVWISEIPDLRPIDMFNPEEQT